MDRIVVLKVLPNTLKNDPQWSERFRRETALMNKMAHPNLVQAYNALEIEGCPVIAMEFVEGTTIGDRIENGLIQVRAATLAGSNATNNFSTILDHLCSMECTFRTCKTLDDYFRILVD